MKAYRIGKSIILPDVRYVNHGGCNSMMFHSEIIRFNGYYQTLGCDRMDVSGFCLGHKISREDFLERYCGGIEPEINNDKSSDI
ncbi:MAG: hypothetical protein A2Y97_11015 [Nitrospirae bacterium RBG_13_39_12]|nr:MAG: hypothetical protein A2Y97_11015 [Nitrospirae bacterium RBG_13_39_12]